MNSSTNSIDYVVTQKKEGKYLVEQILLYVLYVVAFAAIFYIFCGLLGFGVLGVIIGGVLGPTLIYILYLATRHICNFDRKYSIFTPTSTMDKVPHTVISFEIVKDKKKRDPDKRDVVYEREIRDAEFFGPYNEEYKSKYAAPEVKRTIDFRSNSKASDLYFGVFPEKDGSKTVIIFESVNKVVEKLSYYNKEATVVAPLSK